MDTGRVGPQLVRTASVGPQTPWHPGEEATEGMHSLLRWSEEVFWDEGPEVFQTRLADGAN